MVPPSRGAATGTAVAPPPSESPANPLPADAAAAISLRGLSKRYGPELALQPLDLDIREGEFFCLLGPSGCGKTTTLNLIGGFVAPTSGAIHLRGRRIDQLPPHKRDVNTVFQSYALFPHMTVRDNVGFGLKMAKVAKQQRDRRVDETLGLVGLYEHRDRSPAQLSGGEQQRVAVARALVNRPAVLLLDEPLGALDLKLRKHLQVELAQIHRGVGTTFVYVTHDQEEAMSLADRIAVMSGGRIQQIGTPEEIYLHPTSRFVADFIGESNLFEARLDGLDGTATLRNGARVPCDPAPGAFPREITLMVRPESVRVRRSEEADDDGFVAGEVLQQSFLGNCTRVAVHCDASELPVIAELHGAGRRAAAALLPGSVISISWEPDAAVVIEEQEPNEEESP